MTYDIESIESMEHCDAHPEARGDCNNRGEKRKDFDRTNHEARTQTISLFHAYAFNFICKRF